MSDADTAPIAVFVVGTRAQLIKIAPVLVACERIGHPSVLMLTGQHKETMQDLIEEFAIRSPQIVALAANERATVGALLRWLPRAYAGIRRELKTLAAGGRALDVLVHGDTLSTVLGAFAGRRAGARVVHLESGLTSGKLFDPFPEEISRRIVFRMTDLALCPNQEAARHLSGRRCTVVDTEGNTIIDALHLVGVKPVPDAARAPYVVASLHRFQNLFNAARLRHLLQLLEGIAAHVPVHFVLHPATRKRLTSEGQMARLEAIPGIRLLPRLGYRDFIGLAANASCVLTDGGSNQEELAVLGVPTVIMRAHTERPDGLQANARMEHQLPADLASWVVSGASESLRMPCTVSGTLGPSMRIAMLLGRRAPADAALDRSGVR